MADYTPYSTAVPWLGALPQWASPEDKERIAAYQLYEEMYWGAPDAFKLQQTGTDANPIYIPSVRTIVESTHRFLAVDWGYSVDGGTDEEKALARNEFLKLFRRENMWSKFATQKRYALIRGDALWHVVADLDKPAGSRISIYELDPASYFPIYDIDDLDRLVGCHIVDQVMEGDTTLIRRQTYRKQVDANGIFTGIITSEMALFELAGWDDRNGAKPDDIKQIRIVEAEAPLPSEITSLPVYHIRNMRNPADPFGSSQLRGIERIAAAVNQTINDQDLAVALAGLGVYVTDSAAPTNDDGEEVNWIIGPGRVIELAPTATWQRVPGITSVQPSLDHANYLEGKMREGAGIPAIATGDVDVATAESGIALFLRLAPLLSGNKEKETEMLGVYDQMFYDLQKMWFPAYEQITFGEQVVITASVGDPMPTNREAKITEITTLFAAGLITIDMATAELTKLGYVFPVGAADALIAQTAKLASANDPYAGRVTKELAESSDAPA